jgi:RNA polymerase sigma-70 factor, ECF subfamily
MDERTLLARMLRQEERAWTEFCHAYRDGVFGLCLRMLRNRDAAEEASQDVFARAAKGIKDFRGESSLKTWLYRIAHNVCLAHAEAARREARYRKDDAVGLDQSAYDGPDAERETASRELREILEKALGELDFEFREAIILREIEDLSYEEIAATTSVPVNTVKTRIYRARVRLQELLAEHR